MRDPKNLMKTFGFAFFAIYIAKVVAAADNLQTVAQKVSGLENATSQLNSSLISITEEMDQLRRTHAQMQADLKSHIQNYQIHQRPAITTHNTSGLYSHIVRRSNTSQVYQAGRMLSGTNNAQPLSITEATTFCEKAVPEYCMITTCPQYCDSINTPTLKMTCKAECHLNKRCKLKAAGYEDDPKNAALDAQNRDQLWACIAEKRDPSGETTGRRMTPWKDIKTISFIRAVTPQAIRAPGASSIGESATFCEREVPQHCITTSCPKFCESINSPQAKAACKPECTADKRCKVKPAAGHDDPKNGPLDAQNRDQLWACIAEKRDPEGTTSGRRMTPWKQIETPSFQKALGTQPRQEGALTIEESTAFCERSVPEYCITNTCPKFCDTIRSPKAKRECKPECTLEKRCKLLPAGGNDDPKNGPLDAQNRDQLWACIAEKRDPAGSTSGRRMTTWQDLQTDSYKKAVNPIPVAG